MNLGLLVILGFWMVWFGWIRLFVGCGFDILGLEVCVMCCCFDCGCGSSLFMGYFVWVIMLFVLYFLLLFGTIALWLFV